MPHNTCRAVLYPEQPLRYCAWRDSPISHRNCVRSIASWLFEENTCFFRYKKSDFYSSINSLALRYGRTITLLVEGRNLRRGRQRSEFNWQPCLQFSFHQTSALILSISYGQSFGTRQGKHGPHPLLFRAIRALRFIELRFMPIPARRGHRFNPYTCTR